MASKNVRVPRAREISADRNEHLLKEASYILQHAGYTTHQVAAITGVPVPKQAAYKKWITQGVR